MVTQSAFGGKSVVVFDDALAEPAGSSGTVALPAGADAAPPEPGLGLLDSILEWTGIREARGEADAGASTRRSPAFISLLESPIRAARGGPAARKALARLLGICIAAIDRLLTGQINEILHQPAFQKLEASWRGLQYLVETADAESTDTGSIKIRMLNVTWAELQRDADQALEFDQSSLFHKVYEDEFGMAGGEPFGVLIGDYQITNDPGDLELLEKISGTAAAAFAPFIAAAHPKLLGLRSYAELSRPLNLVRTFEQPEYLKWRAFRDSPDARFVGLTLPHVLMRLPYRDGDGRVHNFCFHEDVEGSDATGHANHYLWGNAAYAFGAVLSRAFAQSGWFADIRGVRRGENAAGIVSGLPADSYQTDRAGIAVKPSTDVIITDFLNNSLADLGFIPACHCKETEYSAFYGNQSVQRVKPTGKTSGDANARMSAMLQYLLCASRIAHYLKVIGRDREGSFAEAQQLQDMLSNWLQKYTVDDSNASADIKARYPLRQAQVQVKERPDKPGVYSCEMLLLPHSQLDELGLELKLVTQLLTSK